MSTLRKSDWARAGDLQFNANWLDVLLILIFCVAFLGYRLGSFVPLTDHEAYVALAAGEAAENGHWIVPHCNGQVRLQKTPLMYWIVAALSFAFGRIDEFVTRLPSAASASAIAIMMYIMALRMFDRVTGIVTGLATAGSAGILWQSHRGTADMVLTAFVVATMLCLYLADERIGFGHSGRGYFLLAYLAFALANLAKGPVPVPVVGLPIVAYVLWLGFRTTRARIGPSPASRRFSAAAFGKWPGSAFVEVFRQLSRFQLHWCAIIFLVIVGGWIAGVLVSEPEVLYRWREEYVIRFLGQFGTRRPWHYYLPQIFLLTLPWSVFLPVGLTLPFRKDTGDRRRELIFLFLWLVVGLVFFSVSKGKRAHYILPILPAAIILASAGMMFTLRRWASARNVVIAMFIVFVVTIIGAASAFAYLRNTHPSVLTGFYWLIGIILAAEVLATLMFLRWGQLASTAVFALASGLCFVVIWRAYPLVADPNRDPKRVTELMVKHIGTDAEIYFIGRAHPQLVYYYGRNIPQIPTDQEITNVYLKAPHKDQGMVQIQELTVDRVFSLMARTGCRYFVISDEKLLNARAYANMRNVTFYRILGVPRYFTDTKGMVLLSNCPAKSTSPAATQAGLFRVSPAKRSR